MLSNWATREPGEWEFQKILQELVGGPPVDGSRGFTEIGYVPKSRVIFKKNRWCPFFSLCFIIFYLRWFTILKKVGLLTDGDTSKSHDSPTTFKMALYSWPKFWLYSHTPLCQNEVPRKSPTVSHFECPPPGAWRSAIWGCDLAGCTSVYSPPFARATNWTSLPFCLLLKRLPLLTLALAPQSPPGRPQCTGDGGLVLDLLWC